MRVVMGKRERIAARWIVNILVIVVLAGVGVQQWNRTSQAERALCALRADIEHRNRDAREYLRAVEEVRRQAVPGITRNDIEKSIADRERTLRALSVLDCE